MLWASPILKWAIRGHSPFPPYYSRFQDKCTVHPCSFCYTPDPPTGEHLLIECVGTQLLRDRFCLRLSAVSARNYFVVANLRRFLEAFLREMEPNLWWSSIDDNPCLNWEFKIGHLVKGRKEFEVTDADSRKMASSCEYVHTTYLIIILLYSNYLYH